jgi:hypothetical protein
LAPWARAASITPSHDHFQNTFKSGRRRPIVGRVSGGCLPPVRLDIIFISALARDNRYRYSLV